MNVYFFEEAGHLDYVLLEKMIDCHIQPHKIESDPLLENSVFVVEPGYINCLINSNSDIANIKNKKLLVIHHHKSLSFLFNNPFNVNEYIGIFKKLGFENKNVYVITQLEYDKEFILKKWPGVNVLAYDRWLIELFDRQVRQYEFGFMSPGHNHERNANTLEMKKFSILIRRPEKNRFQFMCELIANGIINNCNYTFVNHTPNGCTEWIQEDFQKLIPQHLEYSRPIIESWLDGIPYKANLTSLPEGFFEFDDYPLSLVDYFNNSKINIVFETEPTSTSFLTEKTYKAMLYKKPFIIITQYHGLKALHAGGYQTFGHVINESYDEIENYDERVEAVLKEIIRLNSLPEEEFNNLINSCAPMVEHNHTHLYDEAWKHFPTEFRFKSLTTF